MIETFKKSSHKAGGRAHKQSIVEDVANLSGQHQQSVVETFHSLIIQFAPKSVVFSSQAMKIRLLLAAVYYYENAARPRAKTKDKAPQHKIRFPKYRKGGLTIQMRSLELTYAYVDELMSCVLALASQQEDVDFVDLQEEQPPLSDSCVKPNKTEDVKVHTSRYKSQ